MLQRATGAHLDLLRTAPDVAHVNHIASRVAAGAIDVWDGAPEADQGDGPGDPVATILTAVRCRRPDLVIMSSKSWSSLGLGIDVTRQVALRSPVPILVIPTGMGLSAIDQGVRRILVALDGSEYAEQALTPARVLADALEAELLLFRVVRPRAFASGSLENGSQVDLAGARRYVEGLAVPLRSTRMRVSAMAVVGDPLSMIAAVSRAQHADLIAMTTRGRGAETHSELGDVSSEILRSSGVPLLLVPPLAPGGFALWSESANTRT
jgi:nucleotide-binding universal stress UspA family protein